MKVVFILNLSCEPNSIKRINEFHARGYEVEAYGFDRYLYIDNRPDNVDIQIVGSFYESYSYIKRMPIIVKGIRYVLNRTKGAECVYYLRGLDVALCFLLQSSRNYIYEEADMAHVNLKYSFLRNVFEIADKLIIKKSVLSVFLSEGFVKYHFANKIPANVHVIPNKLNPSITGYSCANIKKIDIQRLKIGFVGLIRYKSIFNFARAFCLNFPLCEFHFFGTFSAIEDERLFCPLYQMGNCFFHGRYTNPKDLPHIYSQIDLVLSTYDVEKGNVLYAEPNKIYEAIYFETPIIVSKGTFLADKVGRLGIGYSIDAMNDDSIVELVSCLTVDEIQGKKKNMRKIDKCDLLSVNGDFFEKMKLLLKKNS